MAFQRKKPLAIGAKARFPGFIEPALATSIDKVPSGARWIHEIKFDGYRVQVNLANDAVKVYTRRGNDRTKRFKKIADDAWHISAGLFVAVHESGCGTERTGRDVRYLVAIGGHADIKVALGMIDDFVT